MWKLSAVILNDPTSKFDFANSPVKAVSQYYEVIWKLFSRKQVCTACRASEGMFGTRGAPLLGSRQICAQTCTCVDLGFGQFVNDLPGLVRSTPSLADMISLLRHYRDVYTRSGTDSEPDLESSRVGRQTRIGEDVKATLVSISKEVWKCFNIENCLHPYSPCALRAAREVFQKENLLMALNGVFVRSQDSDMTAIVVDDKSMLACFEDQLDNGNICLIDGLSDQLIEGEVSLANKHICLDTLAAARQTFMELPPKEFLMSTDYIPPETFFAPNNSLSLMQFLEVPCLSQYVTETSSFSEKNFDVTNTADCLNSLLRLVQMFLLGSEKSYLVDQLPGCSRVRALLDMKIYGCENLTYSLSLDIPQLDIMATKEDMTHDFYHDYAKNILLIDHECVYAVRRDLCIDLVMKAVKIEVALLERNQCLDMMGSLSKLLKKYSRRQGWKVSHIDFS
jgi:hypothetical protein